RRIKNGDDERDLAFWNEYVAHSERLALAIPEDWLAPICFDEQTEERAVREFLDRILRHGRPTASLTYDGYARTLIRALAERGLSVPDDMSLFGFDDDMHGRSCPIRLTTLRQEFECIASEAVRLLRDRIRNPERSAMVVRIDGRIIERNSCAPPKQNT